jgi:IS30 family transposase
MNTRYEHKTGHLTKELLQTEYNSLKSIRKIAKKYNVHHGTISTLLRKHNIVYIPKTREKDETFFSQENEASFYLAGFIAADGNIHHSNKNYNLHIRLSIHDENHVVKLHNLLKSNSKIQTQLNHESYINSQKIISSTKGFTICSKQIYDDLIKKFNITENKSLTLKFPEHLKNHKLIPHFIRGYFDGDGSWTIRNPNEINKQSKINIGFEILGTENFISNIQDILIRDLKLKTNKIEQKENIYRLRYSGNRLSSLIGDWMYKDATIYLNRKYERYQLAKSLLT